jgi:hypothetical protein
MIDPVREFECAGGSHLRDGPAQQVDHLLVCMAVAIIDDDAGSKLITGKGTRLFDSLGNWG